MCSKLLVFVALFGFLQLALAEKTDEEYAEECGWDISFIVKPNKTPKEVCDIYCITKYNVEHFNVGEEYQQELENERYADCRKRNCSENRLCQKVYENMDCVVKKMKEDGHLKRRIKTGK